MFFLEALDRHYETQLCDARCTRDSCWVRTERDRLVTRFGAGLGCGLFDSELVAHPAFVAMCSKLECAPSSRAVSAYVFGAN